jgi:hypothetical protein
VRGLIAPSLERIMATITGDVPTAHVAGVDDLLVPARRSVRLSPTSAVQKSRLL